MYLKPVDSIPTARSLVRTDKREDGERFSPAHRRRQSSLDLLREFRDGHEPHVRVMFTHEEYDAPALLSSLNATIRHHGFPGIRAVRRGDALYLTRQPRERYADPLYVESTLIAFDRDPAPAAVVPYPDWTVLGRSRLFNAFQYRRTRMGMGHIRIGIRDDGLLLTKPEDLY